MSTAVALCAVALCFVPAALRAESPLSGGYHEAVFSVSSLVTYDEWLISVAGWQRLDAGEVGRELLEAWQLPDTASARFALYGNPGTERGFIRLIDFDGIDQQQIRSSAQSWDTGGWFDVNLRTTSMARHFDAFQTRGWQATSDPVTFDFGPYTVIEWLTRGPDGVVLAVIERVKPTLEGWPALRELSRLFNATQIVSDMVAARTFYEDVLGFKVYLEHRGASEAPGPNVLGLPHSLADQVVRDIVILHPEGINEGSVELLAFEGLSGANFSERARPPNLGILMLRFPTDDLAALRDRLAQHDVPVVFEPIETTIEPFGDVRLMALRGPDGVWLEVFEVVSD